MYSISMYTKERKRNQMTCLHGVLVSAGDIVAPNSRVEIKSVWVTQAGAADTGSQDFELGSLTGTVAGPIRTLQLAAADSSSASPGGMCLHIASMHLTLLATHRQRALY